MTRNQQRAVSLAEAISAASTAGVPGPVLSDVDWNLLLLAADLNRCLSPPRVVSRRVLDRAAPHVGYFAARAVADGRPLAEAREGVVEGRDGRRDAIAGEFARSQVV